MVIVVRYERSVKCYEYIVKAVILFALVIIKK